VTLYRAVQIEFYSKHYGDSQPEASIRKLPSAALLHDFEKVVVCESVLVQSKILSLGNINSIHYRIPLARDNLKVLAMPQSLRLYQKGRPYPHEGADRKCSSPRVQRRGPLLVSNIQRKLLIHSETHQRSGSAKDFVLLPNLLMDAMNSESSVRRNLPCCSYPGAVFRWTGDGR